MTLSPTFLIVLWFWIIMGVAAFVLAVWLAVPTSLSSDNWETPLFSFLFALGAAGLMTLGLAAIGWPKPSLYLWRGIAVLGAALGPTIFFTYFLKANKTHRGPPGTRPSPADAWKPTPAARRVTAIGTVVMLGHAILAFLPVSLPKVGETLAATSDTGPTPWTAEQISALLWTVSVVLLAIGTAVFLVLFARQVQRGGAPQLESHWGGIGGGLGGWRMSSALSYLIVAAVLAVLFSVFLLQFDRRRSEDKVEAKPDAKTSTQKAGSPTPKPSPEAKETSPAPKT